MSDFTTACSQSSLHLFDSYKHFGCSDGIFLPQCTFCVSDGVMVTGFEILKNVFLIAE